MSGFFDPIISKNDIDNLKGVSSLLTNNTLSILSKIRIKGDGTKLQIIINNNVMVVLTKQSTFEGDVLVDGKFFLGIIKEDIYNIKLDEEFIYFDSIGIKYIKNTNYPDIIYNDEVVDSTTISLFDIKRIMSLLLTDNKRFVNGVLFDKNNLVITDCKQLYIIENQREVNDNYIVSNLFLRLLNNFRVNTIDLLFNKKNTIAVIDDLTIITKNIEGSYPPYEKIVPDLLVFSEFKIDYNEWAFHYDMIKLYSAPEQIILYFEKNICKVSSLEHGTYTFELSGFINNNFSFAVNFEQLNNMLRNSTGSISFFVENGVDIVVCIDTNCKVILQLMEGCKLW